MNVRKQIRDAAVSALSNATTGFNAKLTAIAASYGITAFTIDFTSDSPNFCQTFYATEGAVEESPVSSWPALILYTSQAANERREKGCGFSGTVLLHADFYLKYRYRDDTANGMEGNDTESVADAVEDAFLQVFHRAGVSWPTGVVYGGEYQSVRDPLVPLGDGWLQRVPIQMVFGVSL